MNQTIGFVEVWLAQILEIDFFEYGLENGSVAAAVDQSGFDEAFRVITYLWEKLDNRNPDFEPAIHNTVVAGMRMAIHKYWANDDLLNDLSGEDAKASNIYLNTVAVGPSGNRFSLDSIKDEINNRINNTDSESSEAEAEATEIENDDDESNNTTQEVEVVEEKKVPEWKILTDNVIEKVNATWSDRIFRDCEFPDDGVRVVVFGQDIDDSHLDKIVGVAKSIKKSIICMYNLSQVERTIEMLKANYNMSDLSKDILFFMMSVSNSKFAFIESSKVLCFGHEIDEMNAVAGIDQNKEIENIRNITTISYEEKEKRVSEILRSRKNSPVYKFDGIYKDTVTNVIWAVKDRCVVYFLIPYSNEKNKKFYLIAYDEFARRYGKSVPYNDLVKIDSEYMLRMQHNNKEEYIKFAVSSSKTITDQLKSKRDEHLAKYKEHLDKALEHAKIFQRYHDQIAYFNEEAFLEDERKKANDNYEQTMAIDKISSISVRDNMVHVYTHNIYAQDERTKRYHDIGTFHFTIGMHSNAYDQTKTLKIKNTKHQINTGSGIMNAPHVWAAGNICHGNLATGMTDAYKRRNLFELVYQVLLFLESANTSDSAGEKVNRWPEVSEEVALNKNYNGDTIYTVMKEMAEAEKKFDDALADAIPIHI